jgi:LAS superfamily LD-carboxypeptidase LdcB
LNRLTICLCLVLLFSASLLSAQEGTDSVRVGEMRYAVPQIWLGLRMGPADAQPPDDLVPLPDSLCSSDGEFYLRLEARDAFVAMSQAAYRDGIVFPVNSSFRSVETQRSLIQKRLAMGRTFEDIAWSVAPPGYSEHMLGTTVDLHLGPNRGKGTAYAWLSEHAWKFGFVESYPYDPTQLFPYEPWHWRWRGPQPAPMALPKSGEHGK